MSGIECRKETRDGRSGSCCPEKTSDFDAPVASESEATCSRD